MSERSMQSRRSTIGSLELEHGPGEVVVVRWQSAAPPMATAMLGIATGGFVLFVALGLPWLGVSQAATARWVIGGVVALLAASATIYLRGRSATLCWDDVGVSIEQGTPRRRQRDAAAWDDVTGVDVEPIDEQNARAGVALRLTRRDGSPIDALPGVPVADLVALRRTVAGVWREHRERARG